MNADVLTHSPTVSTNKAIGDTFRLLSATLIFSGVVAGISMAMGLPHPGLILTLLGYFGLLFLTHMTANSMWGLASVFALTGFMGYTLGPILGMVTGTFVNGTELVMLAMGGTGVTFLGLSGYVLNTKKDFSYLGNFLFAGIIVAFLAGIGAIVFSIPALSLAVSTAFIALMVGLITYQVSEMVHNRQTNYILNTVTLFVSIYNLFLSSLHLLTAFFGQQE